MRLRQSVTADQAVGALRQRIFEAHRVISASGPEGKRPAYLTWVNTTQQYLHTFFADGELEGSLLERGYWHICGLPAQFDEQRKMLDRLIDEEFAFQAGQLGTHADPGGRLGEAVSQLRELARLGSRSGHVCVPDTNALLHYTRFDQLDWPKVVEQPLVRLVIPVAVVDELDDKKYARREEFQQRARELLALIDRFTASPADGCPEIRANVTVEVLPDERGHRRMPSNDQEILERCEFLQQMSGKPVMLITGDSGMRIKARSRGISVFKLPEDCLLPRHKQQAAD